MLGLSGSGDWFLGLETHRTTTAFGFQVMGHLLWYDTRTHGVSMCSFPVELGSCSLVLTEMIHALGAGQEGNNGTGLRMTAWNSGLSLREDGTAAHSG